MDKNKMKISYKSYILIPFFFILIGCDADYLNKIKDKINKYKEIIAQKEGISNVKVETDFSNFILKIQCDFTSILTLQKAIKEIVIDESKNKKEIESYWLTWEGNKLTRSVPSITGDLTSRLKKEKIKLSHITDELSNPPLRKTPSCPLQK